MTLWWNAVKVFILLPQYSCFFLCFSCPVHSHNINLYALNYCSSLVYVAGCLPVLCVSRQISNLLFYSWEQPEVSWSKTYEQHLFLICQQQLTQIGATIKSYSKWAFIIICPCFVWSWWVLRAVNCLWWPPIIPHYKKRERSERFSDSFQFSKLLNTQCVWKEIVWIFSETFFSVGHNSNLH